MNNSKAMEWVERLHEVGGGILDRRKSIQFKLDESDALVKRADAIRATAYSAAMQLEVRIAGLWSEAQIAQAKGQ